MSDHNFKNASTLFNSGTALIGTSFFNRLHYKKIIKINILRHLIFIGYWLDMEIYVRVLVRSNIARRHERNINYAPERVHIFSYPTITLLLHTRYFHKKLNNVYNIIFINNIQKNSIFIKQ